MVKFNFLLKILSVCSLLTLVSSKQNECETLREYFSKNGNLHFDICSVDDNGKMTSLILLGEYVTQSDVDELAKYTALRDLDLLRIESLPENLNFKSLYLDHIVFYNMNSGRNVQHFSDKYIPDGILQSLKNVKSIKIAGNKISQDSINELSSLNNVESIYLDNSQFDENLSFSPLKNAKKLVHLALNSYYQDIYSFPESVCQIKNLKSLDLSCYNLDTISKCISNLNKLQILDLSFNEITSIPKEINKLTKLVELIMEENKLTSVPSLEKLTNLEKLNLSYNEIKSISISGLSKLQEIDLSSNKISSISFKNLSNLKLLKLNENEIASIPSSLTQLKNLETLILNYNNISSIPSHIKNLSKLKKLDLTNNRITSIQETLGKLKYLEELYLSNNKINGSLPQSLNNLKELKIIDLQLNVNVKGRSLTCPKLTVCIYTDFNEIQTDFCVDKKSVCIPDEAQFLPEC